MLPPDLAAFMTPANQLGQTLKFVIVAGAAQTPKGVASFTGGLGAELTEEYSPGLRFPFICALIGQRPKPPRS